MDRLRGMEVFVQVVESGGVRSAAAVLRLSPAMVSTYLTQLEGMLGVTLLRRSPKGNSLTVEGEMYLDHCRQVLEQIAAADAQLSGDRGGLRGRLSIDMPATIGNRLILPVLPEFMRHYSNVTFDISYSARAFDLSDDGCDIMIRLGPVPDIGMIARPFGRSGIVTVGSPAYLDAHGEPGTPDDLASHDLINIRSSRSGRIVPWQFLEHGEVVSRDLAGRLLFNEGEPRIHAALAGLGLVQAPLFQVVGLLNSGRLRRLLPGAEVPMPPLLLLYAPHKRSRTIIRTFVDFLLARFPAGLDIEGPVGSVW